MTVLATHTSSRAIKVGIGFRMWPAVPCSIHAVALRAFPVGSVAMEEHQFGKLIARLGLPCKSAIRELTGRG